MATDATAEVYDLLILVDATYSMYSYLESLKTSLPKVIAISKLTDSFERIGLLAYRDYSEADRTQDGMLEWSGWYENSIGVENENNNPAAVRAETLMSLASSLEPIGGGDYPEATKTGLARAYSLMREDATTIILLYTDAPPHCWMVADKDRRSNYHAEQEALSKSGSYDGFGPRFVDWVSACKQLHQGARKAHVFSFLDQSLGKSVLDSGYYTYLSTLTRGACLSLTKSDPQSIAQITVDVLLAWMGAEKAGAENISMPGKLVRYKTGDHIRQIKNEKDVTANPYFWAEDLAPDSDLRYTMAVRVARSDERLKEQMKANVAEVNVDSEVLKKFLPKRKTPVSDFARRYTADERYRKVVVDELRSIIETDVTSMSLNPVFGALWRAVCNDRENPMRDDLITAFGLHVERIANAEEKTRMKAWLEASYDHEADILEMLEAFPEEHRFPCVYLDPTIEFQPARKKGEQEDDDDEENRPITAFRRDELLEIGRSCDGRILRRLGKILTRVAYAESATDLPAHIAATTNKEVPKIPLALASQKHGWEFWKTLLHVVLPGTKLAARPAVVLAALAIRVGLQPLFKAASAAMLFWRDKWNKLDVPETWNSSCLGLLLDADAEHRRQIEESGGTVDKESCLLLPSDKELFSRLVAYQHAGANLATTLSAEIGWTPQKTLVPLGYLVKCNGCGFHRSVTIMPEKSGGKCGLCVAKDWTDAEHKRRGINANVSTEDNEATTGTWVECSVRTCRAQYVCYNPNDLNVRPKCHYCRFQTSLPSEKRSNDPAPTLECEKCLSKIIWPKPWRAAAPAPFNCTACLNGLKTIVATETSAAKLCKENGQGWLLQNDDGVIQDPFKRSVFHTISTVGQEKFVKNVRVLPNSNPEPALVIDGKLIRNQEALIAQLASWIDRRTSERSLCSLCFSSFPNARLMPACRRRGCNQNICEPCLNGWYGLNRAGTIINTAALCCPFCRRAPAVRTLAAYGMGVHWVGNLRAALEERGKWIYAWCTDCGKAKQYMERECARGPPEALKDWKCEDCVFLAAERARLAEETARRAMELAQQLEEEERAAIMRLWHDAERAQKALEVPTKNCPHCKVPTQKLGGCDHITCICRRHWCWVCGEEFDHRLIYDHMERIHYWGIEG